MDRFNREWLITYYDERLLQAKTKLINTTQETAYRIFKEIQTDEYNKNIRMFELIKRGEV